jgi:hypothetical protein
LRQSFESELLGRLYFELRVYNCDQRLSGTAKIEVGVIMGQFFGATIAVLGFASAVTILRRTGTACFRSLMTTLLGFFSMVGAHVGAFLVLDWYWAIASIVVGQIAGGFVGNLLLLPYMRSSDWPENAINTIKFAPILFYIGSILVAVSLVYFR